MDKLTSIQSFVRLASLGSFTRVAEERNVSKSLISKEIRALEDDLGVRLLHRSTRNTHLTAEGRQYLTHCEIILSQLEQADAEVQGQHHLLKGEIKVNVPMSLGLTDLSQVFMDFMKQYPGIELDIHLSDNTVDIVKEGFDLSFRVSSQPFDSPYVGKPLHYFNFLVCASPQYLSKHSQINNVQDLVGHNCLIYSYHLGKGRWPLGEGVDVSGNLRANNTVFLMDCIKQGMGVGLVPQFVCQESIKKGEVVTILDHVHRPKLTLYALYPARHHVSPKLKLCIEFVEQWFNARYT